MIVTLIIESYFMLYLEYVEPFFLFFFLTKEYFTNFHSFFFLKDGYSVLE